MRANSGWPPATQLTPAMHVGSHMSIMSKWAHIIVGKDSSNKPYSKHLSYGLISDLMRVTLKLNTRLHVMQTKCQWRFEACNGPLYSGRIVGKVIASAQTDLNSICCATMMAASIICLVAQPERIRTVFIILAARWLPPLFQS